MNWALLGSLSEDHYFDETGQRIGKLLPRRLLASPHVDNSLKQTYEGAEILDPQRAHRIIHALKEVVQTGRPKVELKRGDEYYRLTLFAWDFQGLFWRVAGTLYDMGCSIRSTDLYGIPDPGGRATDGETLIPNERRLIFDVLTFDAPRDANESWEDDMKSRILQRLENPSERIPDNTGEILRPGDAKGCARDLPISEAARSGFPAMRLPPAKGRVTRSADYFRSEPALTSSRLPEMARTTGRYPARISTFASSPT